MKIEQMYTDCLSEAAYYIESNGEVAIIDPMRETAPYIEKAKRNEATIKYIFETHFHADFISGHVDLARQTGATIVYGPGAKTGYPIHEAYDGEVFSLGDITLKVLHTPGHTLESSSFLLIDEQGKNHAIFTGDTVFIGDVGRPDLAIKADLSQEDLAGLLYDSIHDKILPLENEVIVYPAHGAGSACGKNLSQETFSTLGEQRKNNYALQDIPKAQFVEELINGILPPPQYFAKNALLNKMGYPRFETVMQRELQPLTADQAIAEQAKGTLILDTRNPQEFAKGHVRGSVNIGLDGSFAVWVGTLIEDLLQPLVIIAPIGKESETIVRLARVGYENVIGYLEGGFPSYEKAGMKVSTITSISAQNLARALKEKESVVLDVRTPSEYDAEHMGHSMNLPLNFLQDWITTLNQDELYYIHCRSGYRSMIAASILQSVGFKNVIDVDGGIQAILKTDIPITGYVCTTTQN